MTVIVANNTPDAIRGMLKRWFIEPRPNVFVGTINSRIKDNLISYIQRHVPLEFGMLIISTDNSTQGYSMNSIGPTNRRYKKVSGIYLVLEKWEETT